MKQRIIECVPNFSEGKDLGIIKMITDEIESVEGVKLLDVDPGKDTNRTVVTFAGIPEAVVEASFRSVKKASQLIDMSKHRGSHPRIGATDVCPLVPVSGVSMEETVFYARKLAERIGMDLEIPVYCYDYAAFREERRELANCRAGGYEGLKKKLADPAWKPDYGPAVFNERSGATAVGARNFLVAFNVNLNTVSTSIAKEIAYDVREKGRSAKEDDTEKVLPGDRVKRAFIQGTLKSVKAIGWYIPEYSRAQVSMNLTDLQVTPLHVAFEEVYRKADARGVKVTGSQIIGLIPLKFLLEAGQYFLEKQKISSQVSDYELIKAAVKSLGLDDIQPFNPEQKILEYKWRIKTNRDLLT